MVDALGDVDGPVHVGQSHDLHAAFAEQLHERCADLAVSLDDDALFFGAALELLEQGHGADRDAERRRAGVAERAADREWACR